MSPLNNGGLNNQTYAAGQTAQAATDATALTAATDGEIAAVAAATFAVQMPDASLVTVGPVGGGTAAQVAANIGQATAAALLAWAKANGQG